LTPGLVLAGALLSGPAQAGEWREFPTLYGTSGLIVVPHAYVLDSGTLRFGAEVIDKQWADHPRRASNPGNIRTDNYHYHMAVGFLPRIEAAVRISYFPDDRLSILLPGEGTVDRGASGRVQLLREHTWIPAVAAGMDDLKGTRRFHAFYGVASKTFATPSQFVRVRVSAGYGSTAFDAKVHILNGGFGGGEVIVGNIAAAALDYDTEKWNACLRLFAFGRLAAQFAFLNFEGPAGGISWVQPL
jgi:hypothetical protein